MGYKEPALVEQWVEIHLKKNELPVEKIFELVPNLKTKNFTKIEMTQFTKIVKNELNNTLIPINEQRVKCWRENKTDLVQISPDLLIINKLAPYLSWSNFKTILNDALSATNIIPIKNAIVSINFVTIDRFIFPVSDISVENYFICGGELFPKWYNGVKTSFDINIGKG